MLSNLTTEKWRIDTDWGESELGGLKVKLIFHPTHAWRVMGDVIFYSFYSGMTFGWVNGPPLQEHIRKAVGVGDAAQVQIGDGWK